MEKTVDERLVQRGKEKAQQLWDHALTNCMSDGLGAFMYDSSIDRPGLVNASETELCKNLMKMLMAGEDCATVIIERCVAREQDIFIEKRGK